MLNQTFQNDQVSKTKQIKYHYQTQTIIKRNFNQSSLVFSPWGAQLQSLSLHLSSSFFKSSGEPYSPKESTKVKVKKDFISSTDLNLFLPIIESLCFLMQWVARLQVLSSNLM